jgi:oxygen-independent coproporphyrinogen-3 oxidase
MAFYATPGVGHPIFWSRNAFLSPCLLYIIYHLLHTEEFSVSDEAEVTIKINPGSFSRQDFKSAGINRVSVGVQSIYDSGLHILGRTSHTAADSFACIEHLSKSFNNISIHMIYNRPQQRPEEWYLELSETINILGENIKHMSCYELIVERGTDLSRKILSGIVSEPIKTEEFFDIIHDVLGEYGFEMYEVSNYAKPSFLRKA